MAGDHDRGFGALPGDGPASPSGDVLVGLTRWLAEARVDAAASSRARGRWLREQLRDEATLAGVLLDLAERDAIVVAVTAAARRHRGRVRAVADDFCALRSEDGHDTLLAYAGITSVEPHGTALELSGGRPAALDMTWREALTALAAERCRVLAVTTSGLAMAGELRSVGLDVMVLRPDGEPRVAYVPLAALAEVAVAG